MRGELVARYLTEAEKARNLQSWEEACYALPSDLPEAGDERGFPDPPMIEWCRRLNVLDGVCTVQSCAGHRRDDGSVASGHVWLRFSREIAARFDETALSLAAQPGIEQVSRLYAPWGAEISAITFHGNERARLNQSMHVILAFVTSCRSRRHPSSDTRYPAHRSLALCSS